MRARGRREEGRGGGVAVFAFRNLDGGRHVVRCVQSRVICVRELRKAVELGESYLASR